MLTYLKLGGSLITDKNIPSTANIENINSLVLEIAQAFATSPNLKLLLGHGSGSYGHTSAKKFDTRLGVNSKEQWQGFTEVWRQARALNQIILQALADVNLPVITFPPSAMIFRKRDGQINWEIDPIKAAIKSGLIPLLYGDVVFDEKLGGTILSTEEVFSALAEELPPTRILLCGVEKGVFGDFPQCKELVPRITPAIAPKIFPTLKGSNSVDVTGGMLEKVRLMLNLVCEHPNMQAQIMSGKTPGNLLRALRGEIIGTSIAAF